MQSAPKQLFHKLAASLDGELTWSDTYRALYATAACMYKIFPAAVAFPRNTQDVARVVRFAAQHGLSVTPRGAGSSLVGQAVNSGIMLDFTRHMNNILDYNRRGQVVRVQPGVIYGDLNRYLKQFQRYFPPDPSSGEYCTIGGMVANNATGAHSIKYGATVDYIASLEVVLSDGEVIRLKNSQNAEKEFQAEDHSRETAVKRFLYELAQKNRGLSERYTPKVEKNSSGYRLERLLTEQSFNPANIFCNCEGTLGVITEIELYVREPAHHKALSVVNFDSLEEAARAIEPILQLGPAAVEMMDITALELVRRYRPELGDYFPEHVESQLYVEFTGDSAGEVEQLNYKLTDFLKAEFPKGMDYKTTADLSELQELWNIRKASFPLVYHQKRPEKVPAFIEDFVVRPRDIAVYIRKLYEIYDKYNIEAIILGHAGRGNFHARPFINLKDEAHLEKVQHLADEVFAVVKELGGSLSGEHGDGRARAHLLPQLVGPLYDVYEDVKRFFDPQGVLNPGVKINRENQLTKNLRFSPQYRRVETPTVLHFNEDDYYYEIEKCHGCSACRQSNITTTMCPVFQITADELASPRGKANILQNLISGDLPESFVQEKDYKRMLEYCIYCEGCYVDCSSHVDVGRLLLEHKARYRRAHFPGVMQWTLEHSEQFSRMNAALAPLVNPLMKNRAVRLIMEKTLGIDRRRQLPPAESPRKFRRHSKTRRLSHPLAKVLFFPDIYARYNDARLTYLAVQVLERFNIQVQVPDLGSAAMPPVIYGNIELARKSIRKNLPQLSAYINNGYVVVSSEPTAVLALRKEWPDVLLEDGVKELSGRVYEFFEFLQKLQSEGKIDGQTELKEVPVSLGYHAPCHLKALQIGRPAVSFLRQIPGVKVNEINRGCCGIAGTYGFKKGSNGFDQSMKIGAALFKELAREEHEYGLSECSTCRLQMEQGSGKKTLHPLEILAKALGIE